MVRCTRCDLYVGRTQVVPGEGADGARVLFVGEAPGQTEDKQGRPFVGRSGALLDSMLDEAGLRREAVFIANVVRCRPPANRSPRSAELRACAGWLREQVRLIAPDIVVPLGRFALQHFVPKAKITVVQGMPQQVAYEGAQLIVYPLLHPSAILRDPGLRPSYAAQFHGLKRLVGGSRTGRKRARG